MDNMLDRFFITEPIPNDIIHIRFGFWTEEYRLSLIDGPKLMRYQLIYRFASVEDIHLYKLYMAG